MFQQLKKLRLKKTFNQTLNIIKITISLENRGILPKGITRKNYSQEER